MGNCVVGKRSAIILAIAILVVISVTGLLLGLLPQHDRNTVKARSEVLKPWETTRLPQTLSPVSYNLLVRTDLTNFVFSGSVGILIECLEPTDLILIHARNLTIVEGRTKLKRDGRGTVPELLKEPWLYEENQFLVIELDGTLKKGDNYKLSVEFQGALLDDIQGYYKMSYTTAAGEKRFLASTFFDPVGARKAFPCFDEPAMKAKFTITLEHQPEYHALANSPKKAKVKSLRDGWIRAKFDQTVKMSTYLVCYVISDFKAKFRTTANGVTFGVWAQEDFINQTDYALEKGAAVLDFFDNLFGEDVRYPMAKMDMVALPDFTVGAMENWGLITYRDTALLYEDGVSSESQKQRVCTLVAHELSHQWFGNLVTMEWWDHVWLNEGFASYVEYVGTVEVEPDWGMWDKFILYDLHRAMATDARVTSRPIINEVETPAEIISMFDRISYQKGSSVLRMMSDFVGHETFLKGLKYYLGSRAYSEAGTSDLWFHLDKAVTEDSVTLGDGMDIATVMKTWMHQMGFPVIKVERDYTGNGQITARVEQKRFLADPTSNTTSEYSDLGYEWYVPLTYTTSSSPDFESPSAKWIIPEDEYVTLEIPGSSADWLLLNIDQIGLYRVNYDDRNWELIKDQLESNYKVISTASRAALISDAFSLAEASEISQSRAFDMTTYLKEERDFVPWYAVKGALSNIEKNLQRKRAYGNFQKYMKEQVTPFYKTVGWENTGDHLTRMSRATAISMACKYGNEDCIETSVKYYSRWMRSPERVVVHPDMQETAYCSAIAAGGQDEWDFAFDVYRNPNTPTSVKARLLAAMACSQQPWILNTFLHYILDNSIIRPQDGAEVIIAVAGNPVGLPLAWDFFRANWEFFRTVYGDTFFSLENIIGGITSHLNTPFELQSLERFMADHPDQGTGKNAFAEAVAVVRGNIKWIEQNYEDVDQWLYAAVYKDESGPWLNFRLPQTVTPVHYDLKMRADLTKFVFNGSVKILIECQMKTGVIVLHTRRLNITQGILLTHASGGHAPTISKEWLYLGNEYLVVELNSFLTAGEKYNLYMEFNNRLYSDQQGVYWLRYQPTYDGEQRLMVSTLFAASNARKAFPCFDEPAMKATFTITLEHEPKYHALANSAKSGDDEVLSDGWIRATFEKTVKMSTYLLCFIISDYKAKFTTTASGVKFGVWAPEEWINQTDYALEKGAAILDFMDDYFGMDIKYPMAKLDMLALPMFPALAMEQWGLVTYRSDVMLVHEGVTTAVERQTVYTTIVHELAHQWFGNLVTMEWWDALWLNEGFSRYFEYPVTEELEPAFAQMDKFVAYDVRVSMLNDASVDSRPVVVQPSTGREIMAMFNVMTYSKGATLLRMMKYFLGESTLMKGLKSLLRAAQYDSIRNNDLWLHLENAAKEDGVELGLDVDMGTVMTPWLSQIGYPVITISRSYSGEDKITATASQKRFLTDPTADITATHFPDLVYQWYVPLVYITSTKPNFTAPEITWMSPTSNVTIERDDIGGDSDWLLMNIDQGGYYCVNYDDTNWKLLAKQLADDHRVISTASRASLINDAFQLARAGDINMAIVLELISYMKEERDYVPWFMLDVNLRSVREKLVLTDIFVDFEAYIKDLVTPMYYFIGWEIAKDDFIGEQSRTRITDIACKYHVEDCTSTAADLFQEWLADESFYIHPDMKTNILCAGIAVGNREDWDKAFAVYSNYSIDSTLANYIMEAMACSRDEATLSTYLNLILNSSITARNHGSNVLVEVAANPLGREMAWDFYKSNLRFFLEHVDGSRYSYWSIIEDTTGFNTREKLMEVEQFFAAHPDAEAWKTMFDESVAGIKSNIKWMDQHLDGVTEWLENAG